MASEIVAAFNNCDWQRETDMGSEPELQSRLNPNCDVRGINFTKYARGNLVSYGYLTTFRIPANLTLTTGLTFKWLVTDDGTNAQDLGLAVRFGITLADLTQGNTLQLETGTELATEAAANVTLSATSGKAVVGSIAIVNANLPASAAVGDFFLMRLRRIGTNAGDTCYGNVLVYAFTVQNT